ncbi:MAG: hypothetical protein MHM6MM_003998, partial [Cercozoa sp. M6MM]
MHTRVARHLLGRARCAHLRRLMLVSSSQGVQWHHQRQHRRHTELDARVNSDAGLSNHEAARKTGNHARFERLLQKLKYEDGGLPSDKKAALKKRALAIRLREKIVDRSMRHLTAEETNEARLVVSHILSLAGFWDKYRVSKKEDKNAARSKYGFVDTPETRAARQLCQEFLLCLRAHAFDDAYTLLRRALELDKYSIDTFQRRIVGMLRDSFRAAVRLRNAEKRAQLPPPLYGGYRRLPPLRTVDDRMEDEAFVRAEVEKHCNEVKNILAEFDVAPDQMD